MSEQKHEYAVRGCSKKAKDREHLLNFMAADGWEPIDFRQAGTLDWSGDDLVTFRRATV